MIHRLPLVILISAAILLSLNITFASEKPAPEGSNQGPEIFVQLGNNIRSVAFSPDGKYALSGSWDTTLRLWDVATGRKIRTFTGHTSFVKSVAFSPDGKYALSGEKATEST